VHREHARSYSKSETPSKTLTLNAAITQWSQQLMASQLM
jgi:hypothetical protein